MSHAQSKQQGGFVLASLAAACFLAEATYMTLELVAQRVLSPFFGNTSIVWTGVIGMILLSGALGNWLGGRFADMAGLPAQGKASLLLLGAATTIVPISLVAYTVLPALSALSLDLRAGAALATFVLFFLPSCLLGMLVPVLSKPFAHGPASGSGLGRISAVSTVGGITGTFVGGFVLIPLLRTTQVLLVCASILCAASLIVRGTQGVRDHAGQAGTDDAGTGIEAHLRAIAYGKAMPLVSALIFALCAVLAATEASTAVFASQSASVLPENGEILAEQDSRYNKIVVSEQPLYDGESVRIMHVGRAYETLSYTSKANRYRPVSTYITLYDALFSIKPDATSALMIGGGGYSYPKHYVSSYPACTIDVVEMDPQVTELAKRYFFLEDLINEYNAVESGRLGLMSNDGRIYLNSCDKTYDAILNDAFSGETPPASLTTIEAVRAIHAVLVPGGAYCTNVFGALEGNSGRFLHHEIATIAQVFSHVYLLPCVPVDDRTTPINCMIVAADVDRRDALARFAPYGVLSVADIGADTGVAVLTDSWCPVDTMVPSM